MPAAAVTLNVNFNQPITPASVTTSSLVLSGITGATVSAVSVLPGNTTASFTISGITSDGTLTASIAAGTILDQYGYPNVAFSGSYITDIVTQAFPVPLTSVAPAGSLVYDGTVSDNLAPAGITHTYTLAVDPLQTISVLVSAHRFRLAAERAVARSDGRDDRHGHGGGRRPGRAHPGDGDHGDDDRHVPDRRERGGLDAGQLHGAGHAQRRPGRGGLPGRREQRHPRHGPADGRIVPKPDRVGQRDAGGRARLDRVAPSRPSPPGT